MTDFEQKLEKYAELAVKIGVNVQKGQTLVVNAPVVAVDFVRKVTRIAYEAGAKNVYHRWTDNLLTLTKFQLAPDEALQEFPKWEADGLEQLAKEGAAFLDITTPQLDLLKDIDPERIALSNKTVSQALHTYRNYRMADKVSWSILAYPTEEWAKKVFPETEGQEALEKLWEQVFKLTRIDREDPVAAWKEHQRNLSEKVRYLNEKKYKKLHYRAPGTDLTIEFPDGYIWAGGASKNEAGADFFANIPTEEVFTLPLKTGVNGTVKSTKPLNYGGKLIEGLSFVFKDGKIVDFSAEQGYDTVKKLLDTDEGSRYLGEVALVPYNSPISESGLIFFNTLFDENASCHLAIGAAYPTCLEGGEKLTREELEARGVNSSLTHVDFMIGSPELEIDGETRSGEREPVFRNGVWAF
ncbi:aminopeptidase [Caenibacillus caldisaponilyticus]|uniref:aminopeptidase n=1 Tax=Caenibacillus caldisaponilyticus TaxID=1674942 RepID=UPI0009887BC6|nr:aminopeptidase [Caenibacillus caldisaponilyticus]